METILEEDNDDNNYNSPPQSPTNELSPAFRSINGSKINLDNDNTSQSGLRFLENFPGSKLLNMIIGSSSENVAGTPKKEGSIFSGFTLKTPNRRSITSSIADSLHDQGLDRRDVGEPLIPTRAGTPIHMDMQSNDLRHLILDMPSDVNSPMDSGHATPATIVEYNRRHDITNNMTLPIGNVSKEAAVEPTETPNDQLSHMTPSVVEPSPFEPNSSQESLAPYVDSNQSTVSSYAELLKHPK